MRRIVALTTALGLIVVGLGCKHVGGKCDCLANPNDAVMPAPSSPYPTTSATGGPIMKSAPAPMPAPGTTPAPVVPMGR